ncbi:hypothetical protein IWQ60_000411 [Tieghemiomyces parasiticus]|uniref:Carboxypeptidase n=1 Tax=Tieghemiomyces parasiticus TaxID=78921 RepID=A0A9W8AFX2_9FUNG|nr:hypothetical protein IWQ60_000411 [Tieghemiomyces parasiticus]
MSDWISTKSARRWFSPGVCGALLIALGFTFGTYYYLTDVDTSPLFNVRVRIFDTRFTAPVDESKVAVEREHKRPDRYHRPRAVPAPLPAATAKVDVTWRYHQPSICSDGGTRNYAGYLDYANDTKHTFFWYYESRSQPATDPLVLWLSGGPGCADTVGFLEEIGPCAYDATTESLRRRSASWNSRANVLFIDQPLGTGFSYSSDGVYNSSSAAADTVTFLRYFLAEFPQLQALKFHIFGESYAGHYIPVLARQILAYNERLKVIRPAGPNHMPPLLPIPLATIAIGNGLIDLWLQAPSYHTMGCTAYQSGPIPPADTSGTATTPASFSGDSADIGHGPSLPIFNATICDIIRNDITPQCLEGLTECYRGQFVDTCRRAKTTCDKVYGLVESKYIYDVRPHAPVRAEAYIRYLNRPDVQAALGVQRKYSDCDRAVYKNFVLGADWTSRRPLEDLTYIVRHGVPTLLYAGDADFICNWYGNLAVAQAVEWPGQSQFNTQPWCNWNPLGNSTAYGQYLQYANLAFLRVWNAGHEVPMYQPEASLAMLNNWVTRHSI